MSERKHGQPWTVKQLAQAAGVDDSYIRRLVRVGQLSSYKPGRDWLIPDEVARIWLAEHKARRH